MFTVTPREAALELSSQITGKPVCDLGCGEGGLLFDLLDAGASTVSGVEMITEKALIAQDRGLTVINADFVDMPLAQLPAADIYYFYGNGLNETARVLKWVLTTPIPGTFAFGVNTKHYFLVDYFRLRGAIEKTVAGGHFKIFILTIL